MNSTQSAIERIKKSLSYKIGFAILEHKKQYKRGYFTLAYKLYKIKKEHFGEQMLYQQIIKIFPQLAYPKLESCSDYNESIKYKYHLSYMLGEALIHAHKTWYKGGYFKLCKNIQTVKKQYNLLRELNLSNIDISLKNKELLINNFKAIKDILQTHKDYKPILESIFHNFDFFLKNLILIKEWLLSNDFYQRYKKENHPYPSLLDPRKLNDKNEKINYHNIPAELAWEMNLPLPDNYEFIFLFNSCSGSEAMHHFFYLCGVETRSWAWYSANDIFKMNYNYLLNSEISAPCMPAIVSKNYYEYGNYEKNFFLLNKSCDIFFIVRDPITIIKTALNHIDNLYAYNNFQNNPLYRKITYLNYSFADLFPKILYAYSKAYKVDVKDVIKCLDNSQFYYTLDERISMLKNVSKEIVCINFEDIKPKNIFNTLNKLAKKFNFKKPLEEYGYIFEKRINMYEGLLHLPVTINIFNIEIIITTPYMFSLDKDNMNNYENITKFFFESNFILDNIMIVCIKGSINIFLKNKKWIEFKNYIISYIDAFEQYIKDVRRNLISEKDILVYLREYPSLSLAFKKHIDKNISYIKEYYPEYIETWKYYQEFEKMCEELDKKE